MVRLASSQTMASGIVFLFLMTNAQAVAFPGVSEPSDTQSRGHPLVTSTLFIEESLTTNDQFQSFLHRPKTSAMPTMPQDRSVPVDCSPLLSFLSKTDSSVYVSIHRNPNSQVEEINCQDNSQGLRKIVLMPSQVLGNRNFAEQLYESEKALTVFMGLEETGQVVQVKLCEQGYISVHTGQCEDRSFARHLYTSSEQSVINDYITQAESNGIPAGISSISGNVTTGPEVEYLIGELYSYSIWNPSTPNNLYEVDVEEILSSMILLMSQVTSKNISVNFTVWDELYSCSNSIFNIMDPTNLRNLNESFILQVSYLYLFYYTSQNEVCMGSDFFLKQYPAALSTAFQTLTNAISSIEYYKGLTGVSNNSFSYLSQAGFGIGIWMKISDPGTFSNCSCDFCINNVAMELFVYFLGFGGKNDVFGYVAYKVGNVSDGSFYTPIKGSDSSCFEFSETLNFYNDGPVIQFVDTNKVLASGFESATVDTSASNLTLKFKSFGVYFPVQQCATGFNLAMGMPPSCEACAENCECSCAGSCDSCIGNFLYNSTSNSCLICPSNFNGTECNVCAEGFTDNTKNGSKCSICTIGFADNTTDGTNCSICAEGFTDNTENGSKCSICTIGFADNTTDGTNCSICAEGFADNSENGSKCSVCMIGFTDNPADGKKCSICEEGFTDNTDNGSKCSICTIGFADNMTNGKNCSICAPNFGDSSESGNCSVCINNYNKSSSGLCDVCNFGFNLSENCSACLDGFTNSSSNLTCDVCETGYARDSNNVCEICNSNCTCETPATCSGCLVGFYYDSQAKTCTEGYEYVLESYVVYKSMSAGFASISIVLNTSIISSSLTSSCSSYFDNPEVFGTNPSCSLSGTNQIIITLDNDFTITNTTILNFAKTLLVNSGVYVLETTNITIDYTVDPYITVSLSGPQSIDIECGTHAFDLSYSSSQSQGTLRTRFTYTWSVSTSSSSITFTNNSLSNPNLDLSVTASASGTFTITLTISNSIISNTTTLTVNVISEGSLTFNMDAGGNSVFYRKNAIEISVIMSDDCGCSDGLIYSWSITPSIPGISTSQSKLRIPSKTLGYGNYPISLTITCSTTPSISSTNSITITIAASQLVPKTDKGDQYISSSKDLTISGAGSSDPDGYTLSYAWYFDSVLIGTGIQVTISSSNFSNLHSFIVTLTISTVEGSRSASKLSTFILIVNPLVLSIIGPSSKVPIHQPVFLQGIVTGTTSSITYNWLLLSGASSDPGLKYNNFYYFLPNTLGAGLTYNYKLTVTADSNSISGQTSFTVNKPPVCDSALTITPNGPYTKKSQISISATSCIDGDNIDYPLFYFLYFTKGTTYSLILVNLNGNFNKVSFPKRTTSIAVQICDSLLDCIVISNGLVISSSRRLKEEKAIDEYLEHKAQHGIFYAVVYSLAEKIEDEALLDLVWDDLLRDFETRTETRLDFHELVVIILELVQPTQDELLMQPRLGKYIKYLMGKMEATKNIDSSTEEVIKEIALRITQIDKSEQGRLLALQLMVNLIDTCQLAEIPAIPFVQTTPEVVVYRVEDLKSKLQSVVLGDNKISVKDSGFADGDVVRIEAGLFRSDGLFEILYVSVTSSMHVVDNESVMYDEVKNMKAGKGCEVLMPYKEIQGYHIICAATGDETGQCEVLEAVNGLARVMIYASGTYKIGLVADKNENPVSSSFYLVVGLVLILVTALPFMNYLVNKDKYMEVGNDSVRTNRSYESKSKIEVEDMWSGKKDTFSSKHLFLSLFVGDQKFSRSGKMVNFICNLVFAVFLQSVLMNFTDLNVIAIGICSGVAVMPLGLMLNGLLKGEGRISMIAGVIFAVIMIAVSTIGVLLLNSSSLWYVAFISGLASEIIVSESIIAGISRLYSAH